MTGSRGQLGEAIRGRSRRTLEKNQVLLVVPAAKCPPEHIKGLVAFKDQHRWLCHTDQHAGLATSPRTRDDHIAVRHRPLSEAESRVGDTARRRAVNEVGSAVLAANLMTCLVSPATLGARRLDQPQRARFWHPCRPPPYLGSLLGRPLARRAGLRDIGGTRVFQRHMGLCSLSWFGSIVQRRFDWTSTRWMLTRQKSLPASCVCFDR